MSLTINATSNTTPDPGQGGNAVTGNSNTGHASTSVSQVANGNDIKTCIWETFPNVNSAVGSRLTVKLKFDFTEDGAVVDITNQFLVQYTVNGGGAWTNALVHNDVIAPNSGSISVDLSLALDITQFKVRDTLTATSTGDVGGASLSASISNIRLEIELSSNTFLD